MLPPTTENVARPRWPWIAGPVAVVGFAAWFWWPATGGTAGDVAVIVDEAHFAVGAPAVTELRVRGRAADDLGTVADWCTLARTVDDLDLGDDTEFLAIAVADRGECDGDPVADVVAALEDRDVQAAVVVVPGSDVSSEEALPGDARPVLVAHLIGGPGTATMPCEWWDTCPADGLVEVRDADGLLTDAGADRIARAIAAALG